VTAGGCGRDRFKAGVNLRHGKLFEFRAFTLQEDGFDTGTYICVPQADVGDGVVTACFIAVQKFLHRAFTGV